jgi:uncharacterized membrane protein
MYAIFGLLYFLVFLLIIWIVLSLFRAIFLRDRKGPKWLQREIIKWEENKILSPEQSDTILALYKLKRPDARKKMDTIRIMLVVGAVFIGIGVIFFVASNWDQIPAFVRSGLLLALTLATLVAGYIFSYVKQGFPALGKSLLFLASLFWGATVALIAQIYNIPVSQNWYILLLWAFPILPIAIFFENEYAALLASVLFLIWNFAFSVNNSAPNYYYPLIAFFILLPFTQKLVIAQRLNIIGVVAAAIYCCFFQYTWLALGISAGFVVYYLFDRGIKDHLYAATVSFIAWNITFTQVWDRIPNIYFLVPLGGLLYLTYKDESKENLALWLLSLIVWANLVVVAFMHNFRQEINYPFLIIFQSMLALAIYGAGNLERFRGHFFEEVYRSFGAIIALAATYALTFQAVFEYQRSLHLQLAYFMASLLIFPASVVLVCAKITEYFKNTTGKLELAGICLIAGANVFILANPQAIALNTFLANAVFAAVALITVFLGFEAQKPYIFNAGVAMFVIFIITRFVDAVWKLKEKSLFFIVGGIVIMSLGILFEKQRRKIIERMKA